ncbi:ATP synthase F0 subunit 8 (mitochondrion) [Chelmon rostratus]|uniref:ATP synthase complex subunit 8 n=1 Tax=Chelmon rostratus TaxID=109905 RepID=A0A0U1XUD4_CHERO|nr:ATP synthase F0 subunit 8 [Chelmon rostratus]AIY72677.1 ATP synthase F0 subunit 8 [Chelmon rostratus]
MPQLDPAPWFATLLLSWLVFLTIIPPKIMSHQFPNEFSPQGTKKPQTESWTWPWY